MLKEEMELIDRIIRVLGRTLDRVWNEFILGGEIASIFLAFGVLAIAIMIVCWGGYFLWNKVIDPMLGEKMDPFLKRIDQKLKQ
jgi:hypothetical protein